MRWRSGPKISSGMTLSQPLVDPPSRFVARSWRRRWCGRGRCAGGYNRPVSHWHYLRACAPAPRDRRAFAAVDTRFPSVKARNTAISRGRRKHEPPSSSIFAVVSVDAPEMQARRANVFPPHVIAVLLPPLRSVCRRHTGDVPFRELVQAIAVGCSNLFEFEAY